MDQIFKIGKLVYHHQGYHRKQHASAKFQRLIVLLRNSRMQSLIDPFYPHFASLGHKKGLNLPLGCFFFSKIDRL